ncbi:MAG: hypothetical protein D6795_02700 [Deltaproteobacteria bacterium]|nr:MAG: hypothetical protein D6795_02700 [Deltaproteobacteria bacterium]
MGKAFLPSMVLRSVAKILPRNASFIHDITRSKRCHRARKLFALHRLAPARQGDGVGERREEGGVLGSRGVIDKSPQRRYLDYHLPRWRSIAEGSPEPRSTVDPPAPPSAAVSRWKGEGRPTCRKIEGEPRGIPEAGTEGEEPTDPGKQGGAVWIEP